MFHGENRSEAMLSCGQCFMSVPSTQQVLKSDALRCASSCKRYSLVASPQNGNTGVKKILTSKSTRYDFCWHSIFVEIKELPSCVSWRPSSLDKSQLKSRVPLHWTIFEETSLLGKRILGCGCASPLRCVLPPPLLALPPLSPRSAATLAPSFP